jgi:capsular polysaccharide transport system ATP-binding protein
MIKVDNVTKSYPLLGLRRHYVFRGLSLDFPERVNVGIVGRNGVGKSTLLRLLGGVEFPDSGRIVVQGTVSPPAGLTAGFASNISGFDNARFVCRVYGLDADEIPERVKFIEWFADIGEFFKLPIATYSSGMRARLAFAVNMAFEYDYYLIDELTSAGDERFKARAKLAFTQKRGRSSVIIVSHSLQALKTDCDVGLYLKRGEVHFFDDINEAIRTYQSEQVNA